MMSPRSHVWRQVMSALPSPYKDIEKRVLMAEDWGSFLLNISKNEILDKERVSCIYHTHIRRVS